KTARIAKLAEAIATGIGVDAVQAKRAAQLCKADLQSRMVGEFPELQGIAGRYYAKAAGEPEAVANAIDEAYQPRFAGDAIASSKIGQVLAIAERLDTLAGGFAAGLKPTGNKDAFALRRNALGLARTLIEGGVEIDLRRSITQAVTGVGMIGNAFADSNETYDFIIDRMRNYYAEQDFNSAQFDAVAELMKANVGTTEVATAGSDTTIATSVAPTVSLLDFDRRLKAVREFAKLPEAPALAAANKRIRNILRKAEGDIPNQVNVDLLQDKGEQDLYTAVTSAINDTDTALATRDYVAVLSRLAQLRPQVDAFFDSVMVNVEDNALRDNRLALLKLLADRFGAVAEIAQLSA
ncbi:MAG: glycine--tRNA ligase subunit beta, partial [Arenimonas sp.]